ncbi:tRNA pseudouridine(13) synthase TruD [Candidatus Woesearchaeota archaeon]|nr:tRNA pseudouridine(13) synthase TruD [Candidatus Woesearchaeota archaeon]
MYILKQLPEDFTVREIYGINIKKSGKYTLFELNKTDYTTEKAIYTLSNYFKIKRKKFGYAGSKDKHAVTTQLCSALGRIKNIELNDLNVKVLGYSDEPISLGDLKGNYFEITVRNIKKKPEKISFIENYFDEQRFSKNNVDVGRAIIKNDFKKAAELIDNNSVKNHLQNNPNDFIGAIKKLPFKIQTIYINAYQSYLWNEAAGKYIINNFNDYYESNYSLGEFVFLKNKIENKSIPLISFDTEFKSEEIEKNYSEILKKENITLRDFIIKKIPDLTPQGSERELIAEVKNLKINDSEEDELNPGNKKVKVEFSLQKGSYATIVVKKMFN